MPDPGAARPLAAVTGASSGIGEELARQLAASGHDLVLIARRSERLRALAEALTTEHGVTCTPLQANLANVDEREGVCEALLPDRGRLDVLVNNAGFGTHGFFRETDLQRELDMIEVNCAAPIHLTKRILPWMLERKRGWILNVSSLSAFSPGPVMAMYFATKGFLLSFSEALWEECRDTGVVVTALCPGSVRTEFQQSAGISAKARTSGTVALPVQRIAADGLEALFSGKRVVIPGRQAKIAAFLGRFSPRTRMLRTVRRIQEQRRQQTLDAGN